MVQAWENEQGQLSSCIRAVPLEPTLEYFDKYADVTIYFTILISIPRQNVGSCHQEWKEVILMS